jgi:hypothetical protein
MINYCYNFNCTLLKYSFNQINTNKVLDTKSTITIYYLYITPNNLAKTLRIKSFNKTTIPYNKTTISYNHFKGFKQAFNYKTYKSIKLVRFWLVDRLKGFKRGINKKVRLKIYKWGLVEKMLLISSFELSNIWIKRYGRKSLN